MAYVNPNSGIGDQSTADPAPGLASKAWPVPEGCLSQLHVWPQKFPTSLMIFPDTLWLCQNSY